MSDLRPFRRIPENLVEWSRWISEQDLKPKGQDATAVTSTAIDVRKGEAVTLTLSEPRVSISFTNPPASGKLGEVFIKFIQTTARSTVTWPDSVKWEDGTAPTITVTLDAVDIVKLYTLDGGTTWYGTFWQNLK